MVHRYIPVHCAGAETMIHAMLRALARRGHEVRVVLSAQSGDPYDLDGVQVLPHKSKRDVFEHLEWSDVIVAHLMNTPRATFLGNWNQRPVVLVHHNDFDITHKALITPEARVDLVAVNSEWMAESLRKWLTARHAPVPRMVICRPLVDPDEYQADGPHDRVTLVNLRRDDDMSKGSEVFWWLAQRSRKTQFLGVRGAYGTQMVRDGLPNVEVLDHVPHHEMRERVYGRTRVLLMPSSYESWGRVGVEALASAIPVVAHPTPGISEALGDAGIYVDREDLDGWRRALQTLALPGPYKAAQRRARERAERLRPEADLARWCDAVQRVALHGRRLVPA